MSARLTFKRYVSDVAAKERLDQFLGYYATKHALRPLVYRPKNSNILLTMDLKDSKTGKPLKPHEPFRPIAKTVLHEYIGSLKVSADETNELAQWYKSWTSISTRKREVYKYFNGAHLQDILFKAFFQTGSYSHLLSSMYSNIPKFQKAGNVEAYDIDHFFNAILTCNLHRNKIKVYNDPTIALKKINVAFTNSKGTDTFGLAKPLIQQLAKQLNFSADELISKYKMAQEINLPQLEETNKPSKFYLEQRGTYIITRTLEEFATETVDPKIVAFNRSYRSLADSLGHNTDVYDSYMSTVNEVWKDTQAAENTKETETEENK
ncbi:hypothetical protein TPHA_0M01720 [Tetrapisispora phaffii CBS 4417]|uniref:Uncharacterized protein n=1 Tax=Tetrapisispora phaffii (strain ATCC 24235 / CBS 4417 / NBRC 1672 / NRRL Y-8282 / UCD 70-5) TaxID=1071381 RepID=G8C0N2_TETPH|nr:hypothetical protein TPHA_0M01720 [Tetrapisispora phaffii CBS 4417]CCE65747.1 hypothetical protein TPHA_0M01720 [Tetrapisispora phaffii CBS 4417]